MDAYSMDLRERVVAACDARDGTREQIAARFSVSVRWIRELLRRRRETGSIAPKPHGGGRPPAFDEAAAGRLRAAVAPTTTPRWRSWPRPPASRAAPRRSTGPCAAWGSRGKKVAAGGRAGPPGAEGRAGRLARGVRRRSTRPGWSSSTRAAPRRRWTAPTAAPPAASGSTARCRTATGWSRR